MLFFIKNAVGSDIVRITSESEFKIFANNVNSGSNYLGSTVFLDSDLSLSGETFEPIGNANNHFRGVFDGQGHVISDLAINSDASQFTGLFRNSYGLTIKNVVLDPSCSITSSYNGLTYVGGIIGECWAHDGQCNIENSVNMADVTFSGDASGSSLYLGGIAGCFYSFSVYPIYVKNCANYGSVTHTGTSETSYIGGIIGDMANSYYKYVYNNLNYGTITHNGTTSSSLYLGGILGSSNYAHIENCVSTGKISTQTTPSKSYVGNIVGYPESSTSINYCYYTSELNEFSVYGTGTPTTVSYTLSYDNTTFKLNGTVSVGNYTGTSLVGAINAAADYYLLRDYSKWLLNKEKKSVRFTINNRISPITMGYQVILLPSLASEGSTFFDGWYSDNKYLNTLESFEITEDKTLYGRFEENTKNYTITFDTRREGIFVAPIIAQFGTVVQLPSDSIREYCSVAFWENEYGDNMGFSLTMPRYNFTLYAVWKCTHVITPEDFVDFSKVVNSGAANFSETTILLESDLLLTDKTLGLVGRDSVNLFRGTFDGQGHIISDLKMNSSSQYAGLFGYSNGLTIKNVVLDSSCSITNSYSGSESVYVGGIIGFCWSYDGQCNIENNVNMADVTFSGNVSSGSLLIGGLIGFFLEMFSSYVSYVKNCANYGSVTHSGTSETSCIGGIVGYLWGSNTIYGHFYNCLNYGTITYNGTSSSGSLDLGGIAGYSYSAYIENCVSAGKIFTQTTASEDSYIGNVVGCVSSYTFIKYCYYTSYLSVYDLYGTGTPASTSYVLSYDSATFKLGGTVSVGSYTGTSLINALNAAADYYNLRDYSKWLLNKEKKTVKFTINSRTSPITINSQVILLPSLATEGSLWFDGWYNDNKYLNTLESFEITEDKTLYGKFEENTKGYTISFDTRGGSYVAPITAQYLSFVSLPNDVIREHCSVAFWETEYGDYLGLSLTMPGYNFTLYAVWKCTHIATPEDFIDFSKVVNSGAANFSETTILLESDLSLSGKILEPIGTSSKYYFNGVLDGQGHIISDLKMNSSSSQYAGLFGYSKGLTIKNVMLDSSCSITNSYSSSSYAYVGGIIGYCFSDSGDCNIENSVNMADVTFSGNANGSNLHLGGITGYLYSPSYPTYVKNCANYGSVTHSGTSKNSYIGGVVGYLYGSGSKLYKYIYNSINYGTITHSGSTSNALYLGGIAGRSYYAYIENCVSAGEIITQNTPSTSYIGSIVGYVEPETYTKYCYFTSDVGISSLYGYGTPTSTEGTTNSAYGVNSTLVSELNKYSSSNNWCNWTMLHTNGGRINDINHDLLVNPNECLPKPTKEGHRFDGWFKDPSFVEKYNLNEASAATNAYAKFTLNNYTLRFVFSNGTDDEVRVLPFNTPISYPENPVKEGYSFNGWDKNITNMPAQNITIAARWVANDYTVTFDVNGGDELVESEMLVTFNDTYNTLPTPVKEEHMFIGWFTNKTGGTEVTNETIISIPSNHTLYAHWEKITNQVEIVFGTKDLSKEEIKEIVKTYVGSETEFTIIEYENEPGETRVIIRFDDKKDAETFVRNLKEMNTTTSLIKKVSFDQESRDSMSTLLYPLSFISIIFF